MDGGFATAIVFLLGVMVSAVLGGLLYFRRIKELEVRMREQVRLLEREGALERDEWRSRQQLAFERKAAELELQHRERERELNGREEEAVSALLSAERDREVLEKKRKEYDERLQRLEQSELRAEALMRDYRNRLQECAQMGMEAARNKLLEFAELECADLIRDFKRERLSRSEKEIERDARKLLITCMQRLSCVPQEDATATLVAIPNEEMKGRIIGREGRNIKSFESITGTSLLIDETPNSVLISSFDPVRREVARLALEALIQDGRIHPGSIEEAVRKAETEVEQSVVEAGEDALRRLRLHRMHPEVVAAIGKMRFRLANNQNVLEHSIEVAHLCALMASELGLDTELAKRAGLLHDIGKVLDQEHEGSHAAVGSFFLKRIGNEDPRVINAVAAHHEEVPAESAFVALVMIADSLSAMRPGVRGDSTEGYLQRVRNLESIARSLNGVEEAFAIQAGREIRVIVRPDVLSEPDTAALARQIRRRIEDELQYPGTIKITVIREQRFTEVAR